MGCVAVVLGLTQFCVQHVGNGVIEAFGSGTPERSGSVFFLVQVEKRHCHCTA